MLNTVYHVIATLSSGIDSAFFLAIAITLFNVCLLAVFAIVGSAFLARLKISSGYADEQRKQVRENTQILVDQAHVASLAIIEETNRRAKELLNETRVAKEALDAGMTQALREFSEKESERMREMSADLTKAHADTVESMRREYGRTAEDAIKGMADAARGSIRQFEESLKDQTTRYEGILKQQVQDGFMSAQKDITDYKRKSLQRVEQGIYHILNLVTKSVLGKALSLEDQQDVVIHALDEAKEQGFFEI